MGAYYLFSDFSEETGFSHVANDFKKDLRDYKQIVFIASCPTVGKITDQYAARYLTWFERIGIRFDQSIVLDNRVPSQDMLTAIEKASLLFLMGGTTLLQMEFLKRNQLVEPIRKVNCLVMGLSAGAINMAKTSVLSVSCGHEMQEIYEGLGLVDISVEPHFMRTNFNDELQQLSYQCLIYGQCDESAIIVRDSQIYYYGDIYLLKDGTANKLPQSKGFKEEVVLLPYTKERVHEFYRQYESDPMVFSKDSDVKPYVYSEVSVEDYFNKKVQDETRRCFAICIGDNIIGEIQIKYIDFNKKCGTLSITLVNNSVKGYEYGTQAERLILEYAFHQLDLVTIYADAVLRNKRSQHILEKLGFTYTHENELLRYYVLHRENYEPN